MREAAPYRVPNLVNPKKINPEKIIPWFPIKPHHHIVDVGCGVGNFAFSLAGQVPMGKVFATDISQDRLNMATKTLESSNIKNIEFILSKEKILPFPDDSLEGAFFCRILHHAKYPSALLGEAMRCLRKNGWIGIIELYKKKMENTHPIDELIGESYMKSLTEKHGFNFQAKYDINNRYYCLLMIK